MRLASIDPVAARRAIEAAAVAGPPGSTPPKKQHPSWMPVPTHTPAYLRTTTQVLTAMRELEARFPQLVKVVDIGDSAVKAAKTGPGNDIWVLRLTNQKANFGKKPTATHIGGIHAREIANPELLLRWATRTLEGYGTDAAATAMLDTRIVDIVPILNPDGHDIVTNAFRDGINPDIWQRKNASPTGEVDLNRNFRWNWNGFGTSRDPNSDIYRGPRAASEPETQAIQTLVEKVHPGIFIDWHSFSGLNLFPWGDTFGKAPDNADLARVAGRMTELNGYVPQQSVDLYPTSGTSIDHVYGVHRIPSFAIETGDYFHPDEAGFADIQRRNEPVLDLAAAIADDPYERVQGPTVAELQLDTAGRVSAIIADATAGASAVRAAEWTTTPLAAPGTGTPLGAVDGAFDGASELVAGTFVMPAPHPTRPGPAPKLVYVRAQDTEGNWGPSTAQWISGSPS